jgi:hypothetical protein
METAIALRKIEAALAALLEKADAQHPLDAHELRHVAVQIAAQAEMLEQGIAL